MKWLTRLLTTPGPPAADHMVYALLRAHPTPHGPEETVVEWLECAPHQAQRVAATLNAREGRRRYRVTPLHALSGDDLEEQALHRTTLTLKATPGGVRYAVSQHQGRVLRAFSPPLDQRARALTASAFAPRLEVWSTCPDAGLALTRALWPAQAAGLPEVLLPFLRAWGEGHLSGRLGHWPRTAPLPGGAVLWAHADGQVYVWPGQGGSVPATALRVEGRHLHLPGGVCLNVQDLKEDG